MTALRRYPVKSMLGENVDASDVTFTGLAGAQCRGGISEFSSPSGSTQVLDTVGRVSGTGYGTSMPIASR